MLQEEVVGDICDLVFGDAEFLQPLEGPDGSGQRGQLVVIHREGLHVSVLFKEVVADVCDTVIGDTELFEFVEALD